MRKDVGLSIKVSEGTDGWFCIVLPEFSSCFLGTYYMLAPGSSTEEASEGGNEHALATGH